MSDKSNYLEDAFINHLLRDATLPKPPGIYVALYTTAPDPETGAGGVEVSGGGYTRVQVGPADVAWNDPAGTGSTANTNDIVFPTPTAPLGDATHYALLDAATGGNILYSHALDQLKTLSIGTAIRFPAGSLIVNEQ